MAVESLEKYWWFNDSMKGQENINDPKRMDFVWLLLYDKPNICQLHFN